MKIYMLDLEHKLQELTHATGDNNFRLYKDITGYKIHMQDGYCPIPHAETCQTKKELYMKIDSFISGLEYDKTLNR